MWAALVVKNPPVNAGDIREAGSIPGLGRSPGEGNDNTLQYSKDSGAQRATVHGVTKSRKKLSDSVQWLSHVQLF